MRSLPIYNPHFNQILREFDKDIKIKGYQGRNTYSSMVREFLFFIENKALSNIREVQAREIIAYHDYLRERPNQRLGGGLSDAMIKQHLYSLRMFFDYLLETEQVESSPAALPKFSFSKSKERNILSVEEIKELYNACETKRDRALISIAYGCGLRRTEIEKLNTVDVLLQKGVLIVREGKGGKYRTVPLSDSVIRELKEYVIYERSSYLNNKTFDTTNAFFVSNKGVRVRGDSHNKRLKILIEKTQNPELIRKGITLHCLRHSFATHLLDNGAGIEFVQRLLGHSEIDMAHLYSKRRKQKLKVMKQISYGKDI